MHPWSRPPEPEELKARRVGLTRKFAREKGATGRTPSCVWPNIKSREGTTLSLPRWMAVITAHHCNYCDALLGHSAEPTVDHFLPKQIFSSQSYRWRNLYVACRGCQRKGIDYDRRTLRPDEEGYAFERYFRYRYDGAIQNIAQDPVDRVRAEITLRVLKLDDPELRAERQREFMISLKRRKRPLRPGLNLLQAKAFVEFQRQDFSHRPFRAFYAQDSDSSLTWISG